MSWNYRVWGDSFGDETWYEIRETYYNAKGQVSACSDMADSAQGETIEELRQSVQKMLDSIDAVLHGVGHEVLGMDGFEFAKNEAWEGGAT